MIEIPLDVREAHIDEVIALDVRANDQTLGSALLIPYREGFFFYRLWVGKEYRGQGVGHQLILMAKAHAGPFPVYLRPKPFLDAPMTEQQLEALYRRHDFVYTNCGDVMVWRSSSSTVDCLREADGPR